MEKIDERHEQTRKVLRRIGISLMIVGGVLTIIGIGSFILAFGSFRPPILFPCAFVGLPIGFVGFVMTMYGYMGAVARYSAQEMAPVGKDTFNYMAEGTKDGVRTLAGAVGAGLGAGSPPAVGEERVRCHKCNHASAVESKFCGQCGALLGKTRTCPACNELNDPDAKFCDNCGRQMGEPGGQ